VSTFKISDGDEPSTTVFVGSAVSLKGGVAVSIQWDKPPYEGNPPVAIFEHGDAIKLAHAILSAALGMKYER
jgi:hypothetical protein